MTRIDLKVKLTYNYVEETEEEEEVEQPKGKKAKNGVKV